VFQYHIAIYYFLAQDYPTCRKWIRDITEAPRTEQRMDIQRMSKVLGLVLLWKKRDMELLEFDLRAVARYVENWGGGELEEHALSLIKALLDAADQASVNMAFQEFMESISHPALEGLLGHAVLRAWVLAELTGAPPREVIASVGKP
jgi:hypothetical protein